MLRDDPIAEAGLPFEESIHDTSPEYDADNGHELSKVAEPLPDPVFHRCVIVGPDGKPRKSWEMWIGDFCFGKADSKESLLACLERLQSASSSFHWRASRTHFRPRQSKGKTKIAA